MANCVGPFEVSVSFSPAPHEGTTRGLALHPTPSSRDRESARARERERETTTTTDQGGVQRACVGLRGLAAETKRRAG